MIRSVYAVTSDLFNLLCGHKTPQETELMIISLSFLSREGGGPKEGIFRIPHSRKFTALGQRREAPGRQSLASVEPQISSNSKNLHTNSGVPSGSPRLRTRLKTRPLIYPL